jgi:hypothetical protein
MDSKCVGSGLHFLSSDKVSQNPGRAEVQSLLPKPKSIKWRQVKKRNQENTKKKAGAKEQEGKNTRKEQQQQQHYPQNSHPSTAPHKVGYRSRPPPLPRPSPTVYVAPSLGASHR